MSNIWPTNVPAIKDGVTTFSESGLNPIISALRDRTDYLKNQNNVVAMKNGYTITDIGFSSDCKKGTIVCYDPADGKYKPAKAIWDTTVDNNGLRPSVYAYVKGIIVSDIAADSSATIMCEGWVSDPTVVTGLGINKQAGNYYLTASGTLSTAPATDAPVVFCCTYTTSGKLYISPKEPNVYGHTHNSITLKGSDFSNVTPDMGLPEDAKAVYKVDTNSALHSLLKAAGDSTLIIGNGTLLSKQIWEYDASLGCLYTRFLVDADDVYTIYGVTPITGNLGIVRGVDIEANNNILTAASYNNNIILNTKFPVVAYDNMSAQCVTGITNLGVSMGPVVQELRAGAGISIYPNAAAGSYTLASSATVDTILDMQLVNYDGVFLGGDATGVYTIFPASITASVTGTVRIPAHSIGGLKMLPVLFVKGTGGTITPFSVSLTVQSMPADSTGSPVANTFVYETSTISATQTDRLYRLELKDADTTNISAVANALVIMKISATAVNAVNMLSAGVYLTV